MHKISSTRAARFLEDVAFGKQALGGDIRTEKYKQPRPATLVPVAAGCAVLLLVYVSVYPIHGWRVALGADTPVYVWWTRISADLGLRASLLSPRPGTMAPLAALTSLLRQPSSALIASTTIVMAIALALATGTLLEEAFGRDSYAYFVTVVATGAFCFILIGGYVSTLAFGCLFVAGLAVTAHGLDAVDSAFPFLASGLLFGVAGSAHPIFGVLECVLIALAAVWLVRAPTPRIGGGPTRPATLVLGSVAGGAALTLALLAATGWITRTHVDTSADAILRRLEPQMLLHAFRTRLVGALISARFFLAVAAASCGALAWTNYREPRKTRTGGLGSRFGSAVIVVWLSVIAAGIVGLELGVRIPAQRLVNFALPLPLVTGAAVLAIRQSARRGWRQAAAPLGIVVAVASSYFAWHAWDRHRPSTPAVATVEAADTGRAFASTPSGTSLIVVTDSKDKPAQWAATVSNLLRQSVPPQRVAEVHVYLGRPANLIASRPTLTGHAVHDAVSTDLWRAVRATEPTALPVVLRALDPSSYASFAPRRGTRMIAPGVISPAGRTAFLTDRAFTSGPLWSSWLPVWLTPALLLGLAAVGWAWVRLALPRATARTAISLAPAFGLGTLAVAAIVLDAAGLRMSGIGKWVAVFAVIVGPLIALGLHRYRDAIGVGAA
ncbi:MAG: hypothetical protein QOG21_2041 [Actinomycetota bacterium]|nr:hypothetical protein [Actinomycetota bacterium]